MTKQEEDATKIALINNNIQYIQKDISEIKGSVKDLAGVYITKQEFDDTRRVIIDQIQALQKSSNLWKWLSPTLTAILTAVITFLVIQYLTLIK